MQKILVENKFGHGAIRPSKFRIKWNRWKRPKFHKLGKTPEPFDWEKGYEIDKTIYNQGQKGDCGGMSGGKFASIFTGLDISPDSIYSQGYAPDGGMSEDALSDVICNKPLATLTQFPIYDGSGNPITEEQARNTLWMSSSDLIPALGLVKVTVNIDKESIAQACRDTGGVIMMLDGQNGNTPTFLSSTPVPPQKSNPSPLWTHYMCFTGAKNSYPRPLRADQSWGTMDGLTPIGDGGRQYFGDEYLKSGYILDCFTYVPKGAVPVTNLLQKLSAALKQLLSLLRLKESMA